MQSMDEIEAICYQNELSRAEAYENSLEEVCGNCWNHVDGVCTYSRNEEPDDQPACSLFES